MVYGQSQVPHSLWDYLPIEIVELIMWLRRQMSLTTRARIDWARRRQIQQDSIIQAVHFRNPWYYRNVTTGPGFGVPGLPDFNA